MKQKANFIDKLLEIVNPAAAVRRLKAKEMLTEFRYEGAMPSRDRQLVGMHDTISSENHSSARDRVQLMAESRDLMQNSPLVRGLLMELATYTFGTIRYQARTGNPNRDTEYEEAWEAWCKKADFSGRHNFASMVRLAFIAMLRDGDCGLVKRMSGTNFRLQLIEADRIGRPHENWMTNTDELDSYFSGVIVNPKTGEPKAYRIFRRTREGMYVDPIDVPANQFLHIFDPLRIDQYRGITALDTAIPTCRDIYDILRYEKFAVKWNSSNTAIVERKGGEPDEWATTTDSRGNKIEEVNYGAINYFHEGESIKPFQTARPNATFEAFIEQLERQVCLALQIPYGFFVNSKDSGGVTGRLESQKARRACARYQQLVTENVLDPIKDSFFAWAISNNYIKAIKNWRVGRWQFSAWPTADIGRESAANIEEHKLGLKTASDIYAEQGKDWEEEFEQLAREQQTLDRLSKEYGISLDRLSQRNPNPTQEQQAEESAPPQEAVKKKAPKQAFDELWSKHITEFNCGTGAGGFKSGNKCAVGGGNKNSKPVSKKKTVKAKIKVKQNLKPESKLKSAMYKAERRWERDLKKWKAVGKDRENDEDFFNELEAFVENWNSDANSARTAPLHKAAQKLYGAKLTKYQKDRFSKVKPNTEKRKSAEEVVEHTYKLTQKQLKEMGVTKPITLYRGVNNKQLGGKIKAGDKWQGNALSSWSLSKVVAEGFGQYVVEAKIQPRDIFSFAGDGFGLPEEREVVVMSRKPITLSKVCDIDISAPYKGGCGFMGSIPSLHNFGDEIIIEETEADGNWIKKHKKTEQLSEFNCGTGAGGFKSGNKCAGGGGKVTAKIKSKRAKESHKPQSSEALVESKNIEKTIARVLNAKVMEMQVDEKSGKSKWNPSDLHVRSSINGKSRLVLAEVKGIGIGGEEIKELKATSRKECRKRKHNESEKLKAPTMTIVVDARKIKRWPDGKIRIPVNEKILYVFKGVGSPRIRQQKNRDVIPAGAFAGQTSLSKLREKISEWNQLAWAGEDKENYRYQP
jgi:capsid protein